MAAEPARGGAEVVLELSDRRGSWAGWLLMSDGPSALGARLVQASRALRISREAVRHMLDARFPVATHQLAGINDGVQHFEAMTSQQEKLAALGRLSAGLAHQVNSPGAARRAAVDACAAGTSRAAISGPCRATRCAP